MNFFLFRSSARFNATSMSASNETNYVSSKLSQKVELTQNSVNVQRDLAQSMKLKAAMTNQTSGNAYLESVNMKGADMTNYENYSQQRMAA